MKKESFPLQIKRGSVVVKIYRVNHQETATGVLYTVAWHAAGVRRTRQFASLDRAKEEAALKASQLAAGRIEAVRTTTADDSALLAELRKVAGSAPLSAAMHEWAEASRICGGQLIPAARAWREQNMSGTKPVPVDLVVGEFLAAKKRAGVDTEASYEFALDRMSEGLKGRPIASLSARALEDWIHTTFRVGDAGHAHPSTFNTVRKRVVAVWRWARRQGYLPRNAQTEAEMLPHARQEDLKIGIVTVKDYALVLELLRTKHPQHLAAAVLAGFCGLRRAELHEQKWADVMLDREAPFVRVSKAKRNTPSRRLVPLLPAAVEWLMLCNRSEVDVSPPWALDRIRALAREAGTICPANGFRHAFISHRVAQTGNVAETSLEAGNSPTIVHRHYRQLVAKDEGAAWFNLTPSMAARIAAGHAEKLLALA